MTDTELAERYRDDPGRPMRSTASRPIRASQPVVETLPLPAQMQTMLPGRRRSW